VEKMAVTFANRRVGDGEPCFITFEAGPTHNSLESAKRLVKYAAESGGDAVKFQIFDPDRLVADKKMLFSYEVLVDRASGKTETVRYIMPPLFDY
jgi:N,N'-diacetyllegionaminate synthase